MPEQNVRSSSPAPPRPHWYSVAWCPVCGHEEKVRIYGEKPDDPAKRSSAVYCGCLGDA